MALGNCIARWLFDEASSGSAPTGAADSQAAPDDLTLPRVSPLAA
jgi:hypothetical protein